MNSQQQQSVLSPQQIILYFELKDSSSICFLFFLRNKKAISGSPITQISSDGIPKNSTHFIWEELQHSTSKSDIIQYLSSSFMQKNKLVVYLVIIGCKEYSTRIIDTITCLLKTFIESLLNSFKMKSIMINMTANITGSKFINKLLM